MKRVGLCLSVIALGMMVFSGFVMAEEAVSVWFQSGKGEERQALDAQVADFNEANAGEVKIELVNLPEGSYNEQVQAGALAGDLPRPLADADFMAVNPAEARLGQLLFYDPILSGNQNISCAHCHHPDFGTSDGLSLGIGEGGAPAG